MNETTTPPGAYDCHIHVYERGYPLAPTATFKPPHAPVSEYRKVQRALGLERVVLDRKDRWIKLSAPYETSKVGPPHYDDVAVLAKALLRAHPDRCLWASNWPHPNRNPVPSNEAMLKLLGEWTEDAKVREAVLVGNPAAVHGF
jgi:predicted TIM-barrel fold metal-dependent hydrolase